jgi:hypothetical protein
MIINLAQEEYDSLKRIRRLLSLDKNDSEGNIQPFFLHGEDKNFLVSFFERRNLKFCAEQFQTSQFGSVGMHTDSLFGKDRLTILFFISGKGLLSCYHREDLEYHDGPVQNLNVREHYIDTTKGRVRSVIFDDSLPHCWINSSGKKSAAIIVDIPRSVARKIAGISA